MSRTGLLFQRGELRDLFNNELLNVQKRVYGIPEDQFIGTSDDDLAANVYSNHEFEPLSLYPDRMTHSREKIQIELPRSNVGTLDYPYGTKSIPGVRITVLIPFSGEPGLWNFKPSEQSLVAEFNAKLATSASGVYEAIQMVFEIPAAPKFGPEFERELEQSVQRFERQLEFSRTEVLKFNGQLKANIERMIQKRRNELRDYAELVESIEIPLHRNPHAPGVERVPLVLRQIKPLPAAKPREPEYTISDSDYDYILKVIRHEGRSYETLRKTFKLFGEEDLRNVLLAHLNGHYEGLAKGEAFRGAGKTDILIEFANRAAFVGECKVWGGQKEVPAALEQLLSYTTPRDSKNALVFFNKSNSKFKRIQDSLPEVLKAHANCEYEDSRVPEGEWRFVFRSLNDPDRLMTVHVFLFDVFTKSDDGKSDLEAAESEGEE